MGPDKLTELALAIFVIKMLWDVLRHFLLGKDSDLKDNTKAMIIATYEIKTINEKLTELLKLPKDVQNLSTRIKIIESKLHN